MAFELSGKIIEIFDAQQVSDNFRKREFVIEKKETIGNNEFTDHIKFQLTQDRCNLIDAFNINDQVKINFNIRGNRWERDGKVNYFSNLEAWRIEKEEAPLSPDAPLPSYNQADILPAGPDEDLPF